MKLLYILGLAGLFLFSCQQDPQKKAAKNAEHYSNLAESEAAAADAELKQSQDNANSAVIHATQAEMNKALEQVPTPEFENTVASENAKKIANHGIDYVNANDHNQAEKYAKLIDKDIEKINELEEKGRISKEDADKIRNYASDLAKSISLNITVVEITPVEAE